ncbi:MAG: hypothetical protein K8R76_00745 [Candidatus Aegiribacteria sp.]|nr:hypothetical protein [Candidatus Aegiribacteria sp.]
MIPFIAMLLSVSIIPDDWGFETSQSYVTSIFEDSDGTMWCSTSGGILHYDPDTGWDDSIVYPDDLPWYKTNDLYVYDSLLWVATAGGGLALRQGDSWQVFSSYEGIPGSGDVHSVHCAGGYTWVGSDGGLARGNAAGFQQLDESATGGAFRADEVIGISSVSDILFLATDRGVYSLDLLASPFNPDSWTSHETATSNLGISDVYTVSADSVFGFGPGGIAQMINPDSWLVLLDFSMSDDSVVTGLLLTDEGLIASCIEVRRFIEEGVWETYGEGYPVSTFSSCLGSACDEIWVGYGLNDVSTENSGNGLGYLDNGTWVSVPVSGMAGSSCYQITLDSDNMYLGSHNAGLMVCYPDSGWNTFNMNTVNMPRSLRTYSSAKSSCPGIWTGSYHYGLTWINDRNTYSMEDDTVITYVSDSLSDVSPDVVQVIAPLLNNQVVMLSVQNGALWIAQEAFWQSPDEISGIVAVSGDPESGSLEWTSRTDADGLAVKNIQTLYPCGQDSLWIAFTSNGGCQLLVHGGNPVDKSQDIWYPGHGEVYDTSWGLSSSQVFCFARDNDGNILAGTGSGLFRWQENAFIQISGISGSIKTMQVDNKGRIWCMSGSSIICVDGSEITEFTTSNSPYIPTSRVENEFSVFQADASKLYFSSIIGLWTLIVQQESDENPDLLFYPQPFLPAEEELRICWTGTDRQISVKLFSLAGQYLGCIQAESWEDWSWNGSLSGEDVSSGVYLAIIETDDMVLRAKVAVVR